MYNIVIDETKGSLSIKIDGHRAAFNPGQILDVQQYLEDRAPGFDFSEILQEINNLWTPEICEAHRIKSEEIIREIELQNEQATIINKSRLEMLYAEEQAYIEDTVRTLLNARR